ncbi:MAG TPA: transposase [Candidatus Methylomirabilis sp.]|nr:transposase [Candidatus Methylomirabilis sp.]HSC71404.1 transposase [Candidatus Methylomirabilis sp.]
MPRQPRLDAPGTLHHVMGRGIERTRIFQTDTDRADFLERVAERARSGEWTIYAWALMPNHFHLLLRTGTRPLSQSMQRLLTGYVVNFNRRHKRYGHLFQNRYKSVLCEDDPYLVEVTRYIHLNPLRVGLVPGLRELRQYPWTGHAALLGVVGRDWQDTATVLAAFGQRRRQAVQRYEEFVRDGIAQGRRPELVGGGLIRSLGGWAQVLALRRRGSKVAADARILGTGEFVEQLLREAETRDKETLRLARKVIDLATLAGRLVAKGGVAEGELRSGVRTREVVRARRLFCQLAVLGMGYSGADVARFLGVTTSAVNRLAVSPELPEVKKYLKAF